MSVVIDTSDLDLEIESEEYLSEPSAKPENANAGQDSQELIESSETQPELEDSDPPSFPPMTTALDESGDDGDDFKSQIWNAEMRCRGKEAIVEDLKEQLKFAKADYEDSVAALRKLATWGRDPVVNQAKLEVSEPNEPEAEPPADESWKTHSLIDLLKSSEIDGLGKKKLDALADICKTFGDFEDLRTRASLDGVHLKEVLPTGFGEKITDQIEEVYFLATKKISSQPIPDREYKSEELDSKPDEELPVIIESVCESNPVVTTSKPIDLDDL